MSVSGGTGAPEGPRPLEGSHSDAEAKQSTLDPLRGYPAPDPRGGETHVSEAVPLDGTMVRMVIPE